MGGQGSGSVKGKTATNFKDGRWLYRQKARGSGGPGKVAGHVRPIARDHWGNPTGPNKPELNEGGNVRYITRSQNAKESRVQRKKR